jgi:hypothetical protein
VAGTQALSFDRVKAQEREGLDAVATRRLQRAESIVASGKTFEAVAKDWLSKKRKDWRSSRQNPSAKSFRMAAARISR